MYPPPVLPLFHRGGKGDTEKFKNLSTLGLTASHGQCPATKYHNLGSYQCFSVEPFHPSEGSWKYLETCSLLQLGATLGV